MTCIDSLWPYLSGAARAAATNRSSCCVNQKGVEAANFQSCTPTPSV